jgi:hypothetical protein
MTANFGGPCLLRAFSASKLLMDPYLGRCPRLLPFAPLALGSRSLDTDSKLLGNYH